MNKIALIIKREYLTRIRKRTFIISTILFPLFYILLVFGMGYIAEKSRQNLRVGIIDSSGYLNRTMIAKQNLIDNSSTFTLATDNADKIIKDHKAEGYDAYIVIPSINWQKGDSNLLLQSTKSYGI